jgi:hypothetical protein
LGAFSNRLPQEFGTKGPFVAKLDLMPPYV